MASRHHFAIGLHPDVGAGYIVVFPKLKDPVFQLHLE